MTEGVSSERPSLSGALVRLPYDRTRIRPGIVHLGVGAFCRAHLAVFVDDILRTDPRWGIIGASLKRPDVHDALAKQDFLYTLALRSRSTTRTRIIGSVLEVMDATRQREALIAAMTDPHIRIVSLTVTEKGYCHDPATGALDFDHPDIVHDLACPEAPVSAPGLIARALELRRAAGIAPFTVLSCDNLPANGKTAARIVTGIAALRDKDLANYIAGEVAFPSSMVDRIVPATTDADRALVLEHTGMEDAWPVITEPFTQWIVEDRFPAGRPAFETVGAQLVEDVQPFELMKLRMLNGSHSALAYLGYLAGYDFVSDAIADPELRTLIHDLMTDEVIPTLSQNVGDLPTYRAALLDRFANPALRHRTWQIAMDGSQKLPQRLLGTIRDRLALGLPVTRTALGVAAWMRYVGGIDERGREIDVRDPLAARLHGIAAATIDAPSQMVKRLLCVAEVFGDDLPQNAEFNRTLTSHLASLMSHGSRETVRMVNARRSPAI